MKKILLVLFATLMLTSCGGGKTEETKEKMGDRGYNENTFNTEDAEVEKRPILSEAEADFGNFKWGMPVEDIINVHGAGYSNPDTDTVRYNRIRIEGFASDAEYKFTEGKLSQAIYFIKPDAEYENKEQYLADYKLLVQKYTERFGAPSTDEIQFAEGKDTEDVAEQAKLLGEGMLLFRTVWTTDTTDIRVNMGKDQNGEIVIGVRNIPLG